MQQIRTEEPSRTMLASGTGRAALALPAFMALAAALTAAAPVLTHARDKAPAAIVIMDGSRSMWGQIEGVNKIVSARTVISDMARRYEGKLDLGLIAYGHRQSSGCGDVELLRPVSPIKAKEVADAVGGVTPKGSTPIAGALEAAAGMAADVKGRSAIILLSDGLDNCNADPCAVAETLKGKAPDLTVHVVAFDRNNLDRLKQLSCISESTGGRFAAAPSEKELHEAMLEMFDAAIAGPAPKIAKAVPAPAPQQPVRSPAIPPPERAPQAADNTLTTGAVPEPVPPQTKPPEDPSARQAQKSGKGDKGGQASGDGNVPVALKAFVTDDGPQITSGLIWRVFDPQPDNNGRYKLLRTNRDAAPTAALPPGEYLINAAYGLSNLTRKIQVQAGTTVEENFVLNAGGLRLGAAIAGGGAIPPNSVRYDIFADEADQFGNRKKILGDARPGLIIRLNSGAYHIVSTYGDANAIVRADVTVEPGRLTEATINHSAARVSFKLVLQPGGEALADTQWNILSPGGDIVKESAGALPTHILAAGSYSVLARHNSKNYTREFEVKAGEVTQIEVVIR